MTDEQFQKLMEKLEEILRAQPTQVVYHYPSQPPLPAVYDPTRCGFCGGYHSLGGPCPHLLPTIVSGH